MLRLFRVIFVNYLLFIFFMDFYGVEEEFDDFLVYYICLSDVGERFIFYNVYGYVS